MFKDMVQKLKMKYLNCTDSFRILIFVLFMLLYACFCFFILPYLIIAVCSFLDKLFLYCGELLFNCLGVYQ